MTSYSENGKIINHYGMTDAQEDFLKQVLLAVRDSRECGKKISTEDVIEKILDKASE